MDKLIVLGTGNAQAIHCYNTCFALKEGEEYFLTDAGGGNGILLALEKQGISLEQIHHIFITHAHTDHILGMIWMIRMIATQMNKGSYQGILTIYCHKELEATLKTMAKLTMAKKFCRHFDERIQFRIVEDRETLSFLGNIFTFFDIRSTKEKQFGFALTTKEGIRIAFPGDEPCFAGHLSAPGMTIPDMTAAPAMPVLKDWLQSYITGADWLLHEAFCLYDHRDIFKPYEKHHSTVADTCLMAQELHIPNLVLWHTEDKHLPDRKHLYTEEGARQYTGHLLIPDDGDIISIL